MVESSSIIENVRIAGPSFHVDLAPLDALHPVHYSRRLLIFRCSSSIQREAQLSALKFGLHTLVNRCPLLGGRVVPLEQNEFSNSSPDWRTVVPDHGLELIVKDLRTKVASIEKLAINNFPATELPYKQLVPVPLDLGNDRPFAACKVQFSIIDGGTILTFAMSHSVADGSGTNELMRILAEETKMAQADLKCSIDVKPARQAATEFIGQNRSILQNVTSDLIFKIEDHPAYVNSTAQSPKEPGSNTSHVHPFEATSPEVPVILYVSPSKLAQLKVDATTQGAAPISTHDALCALMWRSKLLIRSQRSELATDLLEATKSTIFMPSDARRHLNLPSSYIGNAVYQLAATLDCDTLFSASGLQSAASAVRQAITSVTPSLVMSYASELQKKWVDWRFLTSASTTGLAMGTDWTSGALYSDDWGSAFGLVIRYRYPGSPQEPFDCILPKLPNGGAEVVLSVMPEEVDVLKGPRCFGKYLDVD